MKQFLGIMAFCIVTALVFPLMVYGIISLREGKDTGKKTGDISGETIDVLFAGENTVRRMNLEEYLCGVVAAEMPASFENEALKAQAVAARSYAVHRKLNPSPDHPDASVCTDFSHCKAYKTQEELEKIWGADKKKYSEKIRNAVFSTGGEVIMYQGEVALAVFHSQSGSGRTESSKDVWGGEIPYLVSVESHGEESAPNFYSSVTVSFEEFKSRIESEFSVVTINSPADIGEIDKSEGGSVKNISIAGKAISGKDIRRIFGLRSSCFEIKADETNVTFEVTGYGHGVGMSQYGANAMAKEGFDYKAILTHYYTGTDVTGV